MTPSQAANPEHHWIVWQHQEEGLHSSPPLTKGIQIGDTVRISKWKGTFEKGYVPNVSEDVFTVSGVDRRYQPVVYKI